MKTTSLKLCFGFNALVRRAKAILCKMRGQIYSLLHRECGMTKGKKRKKTQGNEEIV